MVRVLFSKMKSLHALVSHSSQKYEHKIIAINEKIYSAQLTIKIPPKIALARMLCNFTKWLQQNTKPEFEQPLFEKNNCVEWDNSVI